MGLMICWVVLVMTPSLVVMGMTRLPVEAEMIVFVAVSGEICLFGHRALI